MNKIIGIIAATLMLCLGLAAPTFSAEPPTGTQPAVATMVAADEGEPDLDPDGIVRTCPDGHCSNIVHYSPDDGYDDCFGVRGHKYRSNGDWYTTTGTVCEGQGGYGNGFADINHIYVKDGTQIKCANTWGTVWTWDINWDADQQWHGVDPLGVGKDHTCVYQLD
jgi:hypothetical protein